MTDCADRFTQTAEDEEVKIGGSADCAIKVDGVPACLSVKSARDGGVELVPIGDVPAIVNSSPLNSSLKVSDLFTLQIGDRIFYVAVSDAAREKISGADFSKWTVFNVQTGRIEDELPLELIPVSMAKRGITGEGMAMCPSGLETGFFYSDVFGRKGSSGSEGGSKGAIRSAEGAALNISPVLSESVAPVTCPLCWLKFDVGDAMNIATHESLRSDPVLGPNEMLRFLPVSFSPDGVALDPAGMPAPDFACPHCRKKLPSGFFDLDNKIFSIVGAPSSGKSYYLSVLTKQLQTSLYKNFGMTLKDLDPSGNMLLTQMRNRLFSASKPEDAILAKTALEGAMYERYPRFGKMVALPKPMTYAISSEDKSKKEVSIIFYDNAGEHFEPGLDLEESPGAMHVASSAAIFFLFDPAANRNFKKLLEGNPDPQLLIDGRLDQQDTILSEMEMRIKRIAGMDLSAKIDKPLAVIIGKYDIWKDLLKVPLKETISDGRLDLQAIDENSRIIKDFLEGIDPSIVSAAQSISSDTKFFALSALGHSPIKLTEGPSAGKIAPVPEKLNPMYVEIPTLWALSRTTNLIPVR